MKSIITVGAGAIILVLAACQNPTATNATRIANQEAEASGSPFRWKTQSVNGGTAMFLVLVDLPSGPTIADAVLKKDTLALIAKAEGTKGRANPEIEDIKHLKDGREVWTLKSTRGGIAYVINFKRSPQGGVDIEMSGPKEYQKENG
jgi:hypothetical protein